MKIVVNTIFPVKLLENYWKKRKIRLKKAWKWKSAGMRHEMQILFKICSFNNGSDGFLEWTAVKMITY